MGRREAGFTIIELMVVVTVIVIIALIAIPNLISARLTANETAAIGTMRSICTAQYQFRQSGKADEDGDGAGEFGSLGELSGLSGVRGGPQKVPTDLTASMRNVTVAGEVEKSGYIFRVYLPDSDGKGLRENPGGGYLPGVVDPNLSEVVWGVYAWPGHYGISGRRTFFIGKLGDITFTEDSAYSGQNCAAIRPGNALMTSDPDSIVDQKAVGTTGADGNVWRPVQ